MFEKTESTSISISTGTMIRAALVILGLFLIWFLRDLILILLTAVIISCFVESAVPHFRKIKINRIFGIVLLYVLSGLFLSGLFYLFAPLLITEVYNFSTAVSSYVPNLYFINFFQNEAFSGAKDILASLPRNLSFSSLTTVSKVFIENISGGFFQTLSVAFGSIFNLVVIVLISFYLSIQENAIADFIRIFIPRQHEDYAVDLWERSRRKIALWIKGQMLLGLVVAVLIYLILSLIGIDYALLLAIIAGIMEMVPYGIFVALVPAMAFTYLSHGIPSSLLVAAVYFIVHQFEVFLFAPLIIKKIVGLSPIIIILAVLVGFELAGVWGALLGIPSAVLIVELSSDVEKYKRKAKSTSSQ